MATALIAAGAAALVARRDTAATTRALPSVELRAEVQTPTPTVAVSVGAQGWPITDLGKQHDVEGFASRATVGPGTDISLAISSTAPTVSVKAFRMGWYDGSMATEVWRHDDVAVRRQEDAVLEPRTNTDTAPWDPTLTVPTGQWQPGAYLFRLDAASGAQRYIPLTVRSPNAQGRVVIINAVTTWQAYNDWGGHSLYHGPGGGGDFEHRARVVSFDRPYAGDGAADFVGNELPLIALAEKLGLPLAYATSLDLHEDPHLLDGARAVITLGHDEYWSTPMRASVTAARDAGVNVAFLGANAVFRHIRFAPSLGGPDRLEVGYKVAAEDPLRHEDPALVTTNWREPPLGQPESVLTGVFYECNPVKADFVITNPSNWLYAGAGVHEGMRLPDLVGSEYDRVNPGAPTPRPIEILAHSPVRCRGVSSYSDAAYYSTVSGAGVFASGTSAWVAALTACPPADCTATARVVTAVTTNLLRAFAAGPAGRAHPAVDNVGTVRPYSGDPIGAGQASPRTTTTTTSPIGSFSEPG